MSLIIDFETEGINSTDFTYSDWSKTEFCSGILIEIDGICITRSKYAIHSKTSVDDFIFNVFESMLRSIPELKKGKKMKYVLGNQRGNIYFKPIKNSNFIDIKFIIPGDKKVTETYEGEGKYFKVDINELIEQIIQASKKLINTIEEYLSDMKYHDWFLEFKELVEETEKEYT